MPGLINNSTNIFNKFSNVDLNSNKEFLVNAYSKHNTNSSKNTFNNNLDKKTNQKKKILAASFLGLSFVTIFVHTS